ncbi:MAG: hypothetical protein HUU20_14420 [Pirellulales bacterium]|nr:hypothetical protein [Pirellulales bacterium]
MIQNETQVNVETGRRRASVSDSFSNGEAGRRWHKSAPAKVRRAYHSGEDSQGWASWRSHVVGRREPKPLAKLVAGKDNPLTWSLPSESFSIDLAERLEAIDRLARSPRPDARVDEEIARWLCAAEPLTVGRALEALAWAHALPGLPRCAGQSAWWALFEHLVATARKAGQEVCGSDPLLHQLLAGELPLTLAYLLPEISSCRKLAGAARATLSTGLEQLLDGEGLPHGSHLAIFRPLTACWTRCRAMGGRIGKGCWSRVAEDQYRWVVRASLRLMRHDGSQVFSDGHARPWCRPLFDTMLELGGDRDDRDIAALVLPGAKKHGKQIPLLSLPDSATHSEWSAVSVLRPGWPRKEPRLVAAYPGRTVEVELGCGSDVLWSGPWGLEVRSNGESLEVQSNWEEICWYTDDEVDYLELEASLGEEVRVQRHLLLGREDRFLFLADAILGKGRTRLEYHGTLPLAGAVRLQSAGDTREVMLIGKKPRALVLPLALPEWRCDARPGAVSATSRGLELSQSDEGSAMFAPLFFDLDARRFQRPFTWRQLTVAENLSAQPRDAAVGYRAMIGKDQWLIYRTLRPRGNRTVLGHNLVSQMLVARFDTDGQVDPLLEIE